MSSWTPLAAAARDARALRVRAWRSEGAIRDVPVAYVVINGVMRFYRRGRPGALDAAGERHIARSFCPAHAAWLDALDRVVALVPGADLAEPTPAGVPVAQLLADLAHPRVTTMVEKGGATLPPARRTDEPTALFAAIQAGGTDEAVALAETVADVNAQNNGWTPLLFGAQVGADRVVEALLAAGADPRAVTPEGFTGLHLVARKVGGRLQGFSVTVRRDGQVVTLTDPDEIRAATGSHPDDEYAAAVRVGELLLAAAPDLATVATRRGQRPLSHAANYGADALVARVLAAEGVDVDARDQDGVSALAYATRNGHVAVVRRLLKAGANPDVRDNWGFTPLHDAAEAGRDEVAVVLLKGGADPAIRTTASVSGWEPGMTPADLAWAKGNAALAGKLEKAAKRRPSAETHAE